MGFFLHIYRTLVAQVDQLVQCVCFFSVCVWTITIKLDILLSVYVAWWFILTLCWSGSKMKVIGQTS